MKRAGWTAGRGLCEYESDWHRGNSYMSAFLVDLATKICHVIVDQPAREMVETDPDTDISLGSQSLHTAAKAAGVHLEQLSCLHTRLEECGHTLRRTAD